MTELTESDRATVLRWVAAALVYRPALATYLREAADEADPPKPAPMVEPTTFGAMVDTDEGPAVNLEPVRLDSWALRRNPHGRREWSHLANPRPYKASS